MKLGEIYYWTTDKALGHDKRPKYHVFICPEDGMDGNTFLFISKSDYGGDYKILKIDYSFLTFECSFISCGSIVCYTDEELKGYTIKAVGQLSRDHLIGLRSSILNSDTMEQRHILRVGNALNSVV